MAQDKDQSKEGKKNAAEHKTARPMRSTLTALGIGTGWAALHMPAVHGLNPVLVTWLMDALIASLIAKAVLEVGGSILSWCVRAFSSLRPAK